MTYPPGAAALLWYIAASAFFSKVEAVAASLGNKLIPMLAET